LIAEFANLNRRFCSSVDDSWHEANPFFKRTPLTAVRLSKNVRPLSLGPLNHVQFLAGAPLADLRIVRVCAAGLGLHRPKLDADPRVPALIRGVLGTRQWMTQLGTLGGAMVTRAKGAAARTNGKLGGRPRKPRALDPGVSNTG